jgi:hypothetical protein
MNYMGILNVYPYLMARGRKDTRCRELMAGNQSADSSGRPAAIVTIPRMSLLLQFKLIRSGIPVCAVSQQQEICRYKFQNQFPEGNAEKYQP